MLPVASAKFEGPYSGLPTGRQPVMRRPSRCVRTSSLFIASAATPSMSTISSKTADVGSRPIGQVNLPKPPRSTPASRDLSMSEGQTGLVGRDLAESVRIPTAGVIVDGDIVVPAAAAGVVLFAHGSGSSRHSPRNRMVAARFQVAGYATLLMDLLTPEEEQIDNRTRTFRFDIPRLASRLTGAIRWLTDQTATGSLPVALFGASTGAAAALRAAAEVPQLVKLVISRGGRPDLAGEALERVRVANPAHRRRPGRRGAGFE